MPTYLSDPTPTMYLALITVAVVSGSVYARYQDRRRLVPFLAAAAVLAAVYVLDRQHESPREEAVRGVRAMVQAASDRKPDAFVEHLADPFEYRDETGPKTLTREQVRTAGFWHRLAQLNVRVAAWDFSREDVKEDGPDRVEVGFLAKGEAAERQVPAYFRATFARQPDGPMRLVALAPFDAMGRTNKRITLPFFPP